MGDWSSKDKTPEEIVRHMEGLGTLPVGIPLLHTMSVAIQVKLVGIADCNSVCYADIHNCC